MMNKTIKITRVEKVNYLNQPIVHICHSDDTGARSIEIPYTFDECIRYMDVNMSKRLDFSRLIDDILTGVRRPTLENPIQFSAE